MFGSDREKELEKVFEPASAPRPEHRTALEASLLATFDAMPPERRRKPMEKKNVLRKVAFGAAIAAVIGVAACAAPMEVDVEVGRSLTVTYAESEGMPKPPEVMKALEGAVKLDNVKVRGRHENGELTLQIEAWGEDIGDEPLADKLREAMPALASAKITEKPLSGKVESTLGKKLGHDLFNIDITDDQDVEVVRQKILAQLAAQGFEGQVKVDVQGDGKGERRVNIELRREEECPPEEAEEKKAAP
ncbi:hypothetical protein [Polyangium sp. y55x31]|uniref:hypothetical protein n=1 Tax=Polyangium sp. y55x31 TaxID=3042688 RepID=UPI002482CC06|nr:hypothetical protein [Polyangium sp. y55x31]MDI1484625.1 hypothetical protein [Polyangium sp. y55x31]